jgi:hypothetical protein
LIVSNNGIFCTTGLGGLTEAREVVISSNPRLISLHGLENLTSAENVTIANNPRVSARSGLLESLSEISGKLEIRSNAGLHATDVVAVRERIGKPVTLAAR